MTKTLAKKQPKRASVTKRELPNASVPSFSSSEDEDTNEKDSKHSNKKAERQGVMNLKLFQKLFSEIITE